MKVKYVCLQCGSDLSRKTCPICKRSGIVLDKDEYEKIIHMSTEEILKMATKTKEVTNG